MIWTAAELHFAIGSTLFAYFIYAIAVARREKFMFGDRSFSIGAPDILKIRGQYRLQKGYHVPMAIEVLSIGILSDLLILNFTGQIIGMTLFSVSALWIEDMFYYVNNAFDKPDASESITDALGFIGKVPITWIAGFIYTALVVYWRIL